MSAPVLDRPLDTAPSRARVRAGWVLTGLVSAFLLFDAAAKIARIEPVLDSWRELGWPTSLSVPVGLVLVGGVVVHLVPRTAVLGAVLLSAYLGGAVATHLRLEQPLLSTTLFPVWVGLALWAGLALRDPRVRALVA